MIPWFDNPHRIAHLQFVAAGWIGTPFFANSASRGPRGGVSCQKLAEQIYHEVGCFDVTVPEGPINHARFSANSLIEDFMDKQPGWEKLNLQRRGSTFWTSLLRAGDLLGFRIFKAVHHCGVLLNGPVFIHAMSHIGTSYSTLADGTWSSRLATAWRRLQ